MFAPFVVVPALIFPALDEPRALGLDLVRIHVWTIDPLQDAGDFECLRETVATAHRAAEQAGEFSTSVALELFTLAGHAPLSPREPAQDGQTFARRQNRLVRAGLRIIRDVFANSHPATYQIRTMASRARQYRIAFVANHTEWKLVRDAAAVTQQSVAAFTRATILARAAEVRAIDEGLLEGVRAARARPSQVAATEGGAHAT